MKKKYRKGKQQKKVITPALPQNIVPVGERVFDDKNIYIHQKVYSQIHKFAANKTENEHGGILVGRVVNEMDKKNTIIEGFIEAKYNAATPTTLTFTHETWDYFHSEIEKKYRDKKIVGWIHTHPNFGIFLSENDKFIQRNFFTDINQVAYVVDPIQNDEGFFFWVDEKLERCPGFYLFDKNGVKIKQKPWSNSTEAKDTDHMIHNKKRGYLVNAVLIILLIVNLFISFNQANKIKKLEKLAEDQSLVIQYTMYGAKVAPDISIIADDIKKQAIVRKKSSEGGLKEQENNDEVETNKDNVSEENQSETINNNSDNNSENVATVNTDNPGAVSE